MTLFLIKRDGSTIGLYRGGEAVGALPWFSHNVHAYSMDHATRYEGYSVEAVEEIDCHDVAPIIEAICKRSGVVMQAEFVPFSISRNAGKWRSLNWRVTISKAREILTTDYAQGEGHAPAYKHRDRAERGYMIDYELETGRRAMGVRWGSAPEAYGGKPLAAPSIGDVMQSLARDSDVTEYGGFEEWASEFGYDSDSREAESIYRACLEIALKLRRGLGESLLTEIRLAAEFN